MSKSFTIKTSNKRRPIDIRNQYQNLKEKEQQEYYTSVYGSEQKKWIMRSKVTSQIITMNKNAIEDRERFSKSVVA